jgi:hypothetical protein
MNGMENEAEKLVKQVSQRDVGSPTIRSHQEEYVSEDGEDASLEDEHEDVDEDGEEGTQEAPPAHSTRSKSTRNR